MRKKRPQKFNLISLVISLVILLLITQLIITHRMATKGERLRQLESEYQKVELENSILNEEISRIGSLSRINREAEILGLVRASQVMHLAPQAPVALNRPE